MGDYTVKLLFVKLGLVSAFIFIYGCDEQKKLNEFDLVCSYFQDLKKVDNVNSMSAEQRNKFIIDKISKNIPSHSAAQSWDAVSYAVPEERYEIFKIGAESSLDQEWNCSAMEELAPLTGYDE